MLEASGLIESEKVGRVRTCRLRAEALGEVEKWIGQRRALWGRRLNRLGDYLDAHAGTGTDGTSDDEGTST